jgi:hypothetical protein
MLLLLEANPTSHLTPHLSLHESRDVRVRPLALGPRVHVLEVVGEVDGLELVVDKLANVPREVVVTEGREKQLP